MIVKGEVLVGGGGSGGGGSSGGGGQRPSDAIAGVAVAIPLAYTGQQRVVISQKLVGHL